MFGLDFWEIVIIALVIIVFVNPKDLPAFFRTIGRLYGQLKNLGNTVMLKAEEIEREVTADPGTPAAGLKQEEKPKMATPENAHSPYPDIGMKEREDKG